MNLIKKIYYYNKYKIIFRKKLCNIKKNTLIINSDLEERVNIGENCEIRSCNIGKGTYLQTGCDFKNTEIGRFCSIGSEVNLIVGTHPTKDFISTHPSFFSTRKQAGFTFVDTDKFQEIKKVGGNSFCKIGNDVWIGSYVKILSGVTIGDGAIIAAGSVVTKDVEPYSIVGGVPAKNIRYRFNERDIEFLKKVKWWDKDLEWIKDKSVYFDDIEKLKSIINEEQVC